MSSSWEPLVLIVAAGLVVSKLLDVLSTLRAIEAPHQESNPLVSWLMRAVGVRAAVWLVFVVACALIGTSASLALDGPPVIAVAYCVLGLAIASVQACVARANLRGRHDWVTRLVMAVHRKMT